LTLFRRIKISNLGRCFDQLEAVAVDHTVNSAPRRVREHLGADAPELLKHRLGIVNVWRPIRGPVLDSPLALCDAQSFTDGDLIATDLVYPHVRGKTSSVEYNPGHRWYYFSEMQTDEVVVIRVHDSANDGRARLFPHLFRQSSGIRRSTAGEHRGTRWCLSRPPLDRTLAVIPLRPRGTPGVTPIPERYRLSAAFSSSAPERRRCANGSPGRAYPWPCQRCAL
jgi:hypothetical protein